MLGSLLTNTYRDRIKLCFSRIASFNGNAIISHYFLIDIYKIIAKVLRESVMATQLLMRTATPTSSSLLQSDSLCSSSSLALVQSAVSLRMSWLSASLASPTCSSCSRSIALTADRPLLLRTQTRLAHAADSVRR